MWSKNMWQQHSTPRKGLTNLVTLLIIKKKNHDCNYILNGLEMIITAHLDKKHI